MTEITSELLKQGDNLASDLRWCLKSFKELKELRKKFSKNNLAAVLSTMEPTPYGLASSKKIIDEIYHDTAYLNAELMDKVDRAMRLLNELEIDQASVAKNSDKVVAHRLALLIKTAVNSLTDNDYTDNFFYSGDTKLLTKYQGELSKILGKFGTLTGAEQVSLENALSELTEKLQEAKTDIDIANFEIQLLMAEATNDHGSSVESCRKKFEVLVKKRQAETIEHLFSEEAKKMEDNPQVLGAMNTWSSKFKCGFLPKLRRTYNIDRIETDYLLLLLSFFSCFNKLKNAEDIKMLEKMNLATADEIVLVLDVFYAVCYANNVNLENSDTVMSTMKDFLKGERLLIMDGGSFYENWKENIMPDNKYSVKGKSCTKNNKFIKGNWIGKASFGSTQCVAMTGTWLQLDALKNDTGLSNFFSRLFNYLRDKLIPKKGLKISISSFASGEPLRPIIFESQMSHAKYGRLCKLNKQGAIKSNLDDNKVKDGKEEPQNKLPTP